MKRPFSFRPPPLPPPARRAALLAAGTGLIAATYGLTRLAYGLVLPDVQAELALDDAAAGRAALGASLAYCLAAVTGFVAAGSHRRALVAAAALTAGAGAAGMALAPTAGGFAAAAVLSSAGAGFASPALVQVVAGHVPPAAADRAQAVVNAGTGPGLVAAGVLALVVLPDWRLAWGVVAVVTAAAGALVLALDRGDERSDRAPRDGPERAEGAARATSGDEAASGHARPAGGTAPAKRLASALPPAAWFAAHRRLLVAALLLGAGSAAVWTYGRSLLVGAGAGPTASIAAWIAVGAGGAAVIGTARPLTANGPRTAWGVTVLAVAAATAAFALVPGATGPALAAAAVFGWGYTAATGALIAWTVRLDPGRAPSGTSMLFVVLVLGQGAGSAAAGALGDGWGLRPTFLAAAVVVAGAALVTRRAGDEGAPAGRSADGVRRRARAPRAGRPAAPARRT